MAKFISPVLLALSLTFACLSLLPVASAVPRRITRESNRRELNLSDIVDRGSRPSPQFVATTASVNNERAAGTQGEEPIQYWDGGVMHAPLNVYIIYYGDWPRGSGQNVIENFIQSLTLLNKEPQGKAGDQTVAKWWGISAAYYSVDPNSGAKRGVSKEVKLAKVVYDKGSSGKNICKDTVWKVIKSKIGSGKAFPYDFNGIYLLLTGEDVDVEGFCSDYCGYHNANETKSKRVAYAVVGYEGRCENGCGSKTFSPNANPAIDAMVSTIAHEITETATDPDVCCGWFDKSGNENADKCSYEYGPTKTVRNVAHKGNAAEYNLVGRKNMKFLVQQNWDRITNACASQMTP